MPAVSTLLQAITMMLIMSRRIKRHLRPLNPASPTNAPVNNEALNPDRVSNTNALQGEQNASDEQGLADYERYKKQKEQEMLSGDYTSVE